MAGESNAEFVGEGSGPLKNSRESGDVWDVGGDAINPTPRVFPGDTSDLVPGFVGAFTGDSCIMRSL